MLLGPSLVKIHLKNTDDVFLFADYQNKRELNLKILDLNRNEVFTGLNTDDDLRLQASRLHLSFEDFISTTKDALFVPSSKDFIYSLDESRGSYTFKWKSIDVEETVISLGSMTMEKTNPSEIFTQVLLSISDEMHNLRSKVFNLDSKLNESRNETSKAINQLSDIANIKEILEKELYSKFILVLNEKKKRIRKLEQDKKPNLSSNVSNRKNANKSRGLCISDSSEEMEEDLDLNQPGPSKIKRDSLLLLEETKTKLPMTQTKRRVRKAPTGKNITTYTHTPFTSIPVQNEVSENIEIESIDSLLNSL